LAVTPFQVLAILLERPGDVFTREELPKRIWPHTVDVDHNLNTAINKIRKALGDSSENPRFVEPRRGNRFIAPTTVNGAVAAAVMFLFSSFNWGPGASSSASAAMRITRSK